MSVHWPLVRVEDRDEGGGWIPHLRWNFSATQSDATCR